MLSRKKKDLRKLDDVVKTNSEKSENEINRLWDVIDRMDLQINTLENKVMELEKKIEAKRERCTIKGLFRYSTIR